MDPAVGLAADRSAYGHAHTVAPACAVLAAWPAPVKSCVADAQSPTALVACWPDPVERERVARIADNADD